MSMEDIDFWLVTFFGHPMNGRKNVKGDFKKMAYNNTWFIENRYTNIYYTAENTYFLNYVSTQRRNVFLK